MNCEPTTIGARTARPQVHDNRQESRGQAVRAPCSSNSQHAFTLTELLVVIVTLALLALFVLPAFAASKEKSKRAECVNNLHQSWLTLQMYADQNADWLPLVPEPDPTGNNRKSGSSLWDLPVWVANKLTDGGVRKRIMYCPEQIGDGRPAAILLWSDQIDYRITMYFWLFKRNDSRDSNPDGSYTATPAWPKVPNNDPNRLLRKISESWTNTIALSESELGTDVTISEGAGTTSDKFTGVTANSIVFLQFGIGYTSSHMAGRLPSGGNILFQDGHVGWRPFEQMRMQLLWTSSRYFWF